MAAPSLFYRCMIKLLQYHFLGSSATSVIGDVHEENTRQTIGVYSLNFAVGVDTANHTTVDATNHDVLDIVGAQ